jgi:hypothetical protein
MCNVEHRTVDQCVTVTVLLMFAWPGDRAKRAGRDSSFREGTVATGEGIKSVEIANVEQQKDGLAFDVC